MKTAVSRWFPLSERRPTDNRRLAVLDFRGYEHVDPYLANRERLLARARYAAPEPDILVVGPRTPLEGEVKLRELLEKSSPERVVLDVSTLPRSYLFATCRLLCELQLETTIRYYSPQIYGGQLSRGVRRVQPIPGFEGMAVGSGNTTLVLILGFEGYKALYAWEHLGASRTVALLGDPPYRAEFLATAERNNSELFKQLGERSEIARLHTFDIEYACRQLGELYSRLREEDQDTELTLCPLGTKPQSVAAFAFAYSHPEVAVAYVSSLIYYTGDYSRGYDEQCSEVSLPNP